MTPATARSERSRLLAALLAALLLSTLLLGIGREVSAQETAPTARNNLTAVVDSRYGIQLYNAYANGFRWTQFSASFGLWGPWNNRGNQSGWPVTQWDPMLVGIAWNDFLTFPPLARINVFHEFTVNSNPPALWQGDVYRSASLFAANPAYSWNYGINFSPAPGMFPKTGFTRFPGYLNVWGTDTAAHHPYLPASAADVARHGTPATQLMERFWNGSSWSGGSHGNGVDLEGYPILLGPSGSVWGTHDGDNLGFVAVTQDYGSPLAPKIELLSWDQGRALWGWGSLGTPRSRLPYLRAPLVVGYSRNDEWRVRVFVVGLDDSSGDPDARRWKLFSIERHANGSWRDDRGIQGFWNSHGEAPNVAPTARYGELADNQLPYGFDLTRAVVWNDGAQTRVNVFGHSDAGEQMPEFWFNGSTWQWGGTPHVNPVSTGTLRCAGAVKVARPAANGVGNQFRVSAFVEIGSQVWKRYYDTLNGSVWKWQRRL